MSIEQLNKAVSAAGYAMATPDDDAVAATDAKVEVAVAPSRAMVVAEPALKMGPAEAMANLTTWVKGHWPGFGWRQPA
jgi:hypothetical protein